MNLSRFLKAEKCRRLVCMPEPWPRLFFFLSLSASFRRHFFPSTLSIFVVSSGGGLSSTALRRKHQLCLCTGNTHKKQHIAHLLHVFHPRSPSSRSSRSPTTTTLPSIPPLASPRHQRSPRGTSGNDPCSNAAPTQVVAEGRPT